MQQLIWGLLVFNFVRVLVEDYINGAFSVAAVINNNSKFLSNITNIRSRHERLEPTLLLRIRQSVETYDNVLVDAVLVR